MEHKILWISFHGPLWLAADFSSLPIWWAACAAIPIGLVTRWVTYRSRWF